jgi:hypothetical protein
MGVVGLVGGKASGSGPRCSARVPGTWYVPFICRYVGTWVLMCVLRTVSCCVRARFQGTNHDWGDHETR